MASSRAMSLPNREEANVAVASYYVGGDPTQLGFSKRGRLRRVVEEGRRRFLMSDGKMFSALFLGSQGNPDRGRRNRKEADGKKYRRRRRKEGGSSSTPDRSGLSDLLLSLGEEADEELEEPSFSSSCVSLEAGAEAGRLFQVGGHLLRPRGGPHKAPPKKFVSNSEAPTRKAKERRRRVAPKRKAAGTTTPAKESKRGRGGGERGPYGGMSRSEVRSLAREAGAARVGAGMEADAEESLRLFLRVNIRALCRMGKDVVDEEDVAEALRRNKFRREEEEEEEDWEE